MHIVITGGTGFLGRALTAALLQEGHRVTVLTRRAQPPSDAPGPATPQYVRWHPQDSGEAADDSGWQDTVKAADAVINLAGATIGQRWTRAGKELILQSRLQSTNAILRALQDRQPPHPTLINASGIGYYGPRGDETVTEATAPGSDFVAQVCKAWEDAALRAQSLGGRVVLVRTGLVLGQGGILARMVLPFRLFVGGPVGTGRQWMSWIHLDDYVRLILFVLANQQVHGPVNATAPNPVTNREFSHTLGKVLRRPAALPAPAFALRLLLGEMSMLLLTGQRVLPQMAEEAGFHHTHRDLEPALQSILRS